MDSPASFPAAMLTILGFGTLVVAVYKLFQIASELGEIKSLLSKRAIGSPDTGILVAEPAVRGALGLESEAYAAELLHQVQAGRAGKWPEPADQETWPDAALAHRAVAVDEPVSEIYSGHGSPAALPPDDEAGEVEAAYQEYGEREESIGEHAGVKLWSQAEPDDEPPALTPEVISPSDHAGHAAGDHAQQGYPERGYGEGGYGEGVYGYQHEVEDAWTEAAPGGRFEAAQARAVHSTAVPSTVAPSTVTPVTAAPFSFPPSMAARSAPGTPVQSAHDAQQLSALHSSVERDVRRSGILRNDPEVHELRLPEPPEPANQQQLGSIGAPRNPPPAGLEEPAATILLRPAKLNHPSSDRPGNPEPGALADLPSFTPSKLRGSDWDDAF